jgi:uncharacterized membrane protein
VKSVPRVVFVDLLRFVAALQMLQGHTIAALLSPDYRHGRWYALWSAARGLTSVAFLFAAGLSFYLATERGSELQADTRSGAGRRSLRALRLIGLGYLLHLPVAAVVSRDPATRIRALHEFVAVDVLQCIGVSMLVLEALRRSIPTARGRVFACLGLGAVCIALAPLAAGLPSDGALRPLLAYLTPSGGSLFPLTPWAAHVALGFACGALVRAPLRGSIPVRLGMLTAALVALYALCAAVEVPRVVSDHVSRLAGVGALAWALSWLGERMRAAPPAIAVLARQTLVLYVFHVLLVYGQGVGLLAWIGPRLGPAAALTATVFVVGSSVAVAVAYDRLARARGTG